MYDHRRPDVQQNTHVARVFACWVIKVQRCPGNSHAHGHTKATVRYISPMTSNAATLSMVQVMAVKKGTFVSLRLSEMSMIPG